MRRVLALPRLRVPEFGQSFGGVARHGEVDLAAVVVPVERDADVLLTVPVRLQVVVFSDGVDKVLSVLLADVFDPEVVNNERELDWTPLVEPQSRDELALVVPPPVQAFFEELLREDPCLG